MLRGELAERDPASGVDGRVPVRGQSLTLAEIQVRTWHVLCGIIPHGVLSRGWMIWLVGFHHTTDRDAFVGFARDAPMGACLPSLFLSLPFPVFLPFCLCSPPRNLFFPIWLT